MLKVTVLSTRQVRGIGVSVSTKIIEGQPSARMAARLMINDELTEFEINGYGKPYFGAADLTFVIPERSECEQQSIIDALAEEPSLYLNALMPAIAGEPRQPRKRVE